MRTYAEKAAKNSYLPFFIRFVLDRKKKNAEEEKNETMTIFFLSFEFQVKLRVRLHVAIIFFFSDVFLWEASVICC